MFKELKQKQKKSKIKIKTLKKNTVEEQNKNIAIGFGHLVQLTLLSNLCMNTDDIDTKTVLLSLLNKFTFTHNTIFTINGNC